MRDADFKVDRNFPHSRSIFFFPLPRTFPHSLFLPGAAALPPLPADAAAPLPPWSRAPSPPPEPAPLPPWSRAHLPRGRCRRSPSSPERVSPPLSPAPLPPWAAALDPARCGGSPSSPPRRSPGGGTNPAAALAPSIGALATAPSTHVGNSGGHALLYPCLPPLLGPKR